MDGKGPYSFEEAFVDYIDFVKHQKAKKMFDEEGYQNITDAKEFESYEKKMERIGPENVKKLKNSYELISKLAEQELRNLKNEEKPEYDDEEELRDASKEDLAPKSFMQKMLGIFKYQGGIMSDTNNIPTWLLRALDPSTPMTDDNETMRTIDVEMDGKKYLIPTIRINEKGKLYKLNNKEAIEKAKELGDALLVPEGRDAKEFSKALSDAVPVTQEMKQ